MIKQRTSTTSWRLGPGSGRCAGCEVSIHEELLIYCETCDRPFCPLCIAKIRRSLEMTCHGCGSQQTSSMTEES
jgi:hypothetical protein